jgi:hypothetical protein
MKFFTVAMAASLILFSSCKKNNANSTSANATSIVGSWEIRSAQNGMTPTITYSSGNDSILKFTATTWLRYSKGSLVKSGTYTIVVDSSFNALVVPAGQFTHRIIYDGDTTSNKKFFQITGKTLSIVSGVFALDYGSYTEYELVPDM